MARFRVRDAENLRWLGDTFSPPPPPSNLPPECRMTPSKEVTRGTLVHLYLSASFDPEGGALTYTFEKRSEPAGTPAVLTLNVDGDPSHATITTPSAGSVVVRGEVTDDQGQTDFRDCQLTVVESQEPIPPGSCIGDVGTTGAETPGDHWLWYGNFESVALYPAKQIRPFGTIFLWGLPGSGDEVDSGRFAVVDPGTTLGYQPAPTLGQGASGKMMRNRINIQNHPPVNGKGSTDKEAKRGTLIKCWFGHMGVNREGIPDQTDAWFRFRVWVPSNFDYATGSGGKFPGLLGNPGAYLDPDSPQFNPDYGSGGGRVELDAWSGRVMFTDLGGLFVYAYFWDVNTGRVLSENFAKTYIGDVVSDGTNSLTLNTVSGLAVGQYIDIALKSNKFSVLANYRRISTVNTSTKTIVYDGADVNATPGTHSVYRLGNLNGFKLNFLDPTTGAPLKLVKGAFNDIEVRYKMNTGTNLDGWCQAWLNGTLGVDRRQIRYWEQPNPITNGLMLTCHYGGSFGPSLQNEAGTYEHICYFDDFVIATDAIGPRP